MMDTSRAAYLDWYAQEADGEIAPMSYDEWRGWIERRQRQADRAIATILKLPSQGHNEGHSGDGSESGDKL